MDTSRLNDLIKYLTKGALSGVSKKQLLRTFKEHHDLNDKEVNQIVEFCGFKKEPEWINYDAFYNSPITETASQIKYPFTQIYTYKNFLTEKECSTLIRYIDENVRASTIANDKDA